MSQQNNIGDQELEQYLQGNSGLSQQYADLPEVKLPDHLDAAILAEAHRAVGARPGGKAKRSWTMPLSLVATLFVVVMAGLILPDMLKDMQRRQQYAAANQDTASEKMMPAPAIAQPAPASSDARKEAYMAAPVKMPERAEPPASRKPMREKTILPEPSALPQTVQQARPAAEPEVVAALPQKQELRSQLEAKDSAPANLGVLLEASPVVTNAPAPMQLQARAPTARMEKRKQEMDSSARIAGQVTKPAPASLAPAPAEMPEAETVKASESGIADSLLKSSEILRPDAWIEKIRKLKQQGKHQEAARELSEFGKRYPDFPLPADLAGK